MTLQIAVQYRVITDSNLEPVAGKPILLATWPGLEPELEAILLNAHFDVVPVMEEHWACDPFAGELRDRPARPRNGAAGNSPKSEILGRRKRGGLRARRPPSPPCGPA